VKQGDVVIYSQRHFEWLEAAGKWPKHMPRKRRRGTVVQVRNTVRVKWPERITWHFPSNIELL
jgi:hypothetical protein